MTKLIIKLILSISSLGYYIYIVTERFGRLRDSLLGYYVALLPEKYEANDLIVIGLTF